MSIKPIRTIFMGTPDFAVPSLESLIRDDQFYIEAVITQPDKKTGRKQLLTPPPVKKVAEKNDIPVFQPVTISDIKEALKNYEPDIMVVVAYSQKIPQDILNVPRYGIFNVHGSLLPKYRGASCLQAPIWNGDPKTGVTIMKMDAGLDTGDILFQKKIRLSEEDTASTIHDKLAELGANILPRTLKDYINGKITPSSQKDVDATYVRALQKEDGKIDWTKPAEYLERMIRALQPWPGTFSYIHLPGHEKNIIKILHVKPVILNINEYPVGTLFMDEQEGLAVQCGKNALLIDKIQPAGKKPMTGKEFLQGYKDLIGRPLE